jgi:hypothetical protein
MDRAGTSATNRFSMELALFPPQSSRSHMRRSSAHTGNAATWPRGLFNYRELPIDPILTAAENRGSLTRVLHHV